jgi:hypothetical protein
MSSYSPDEYESDSFDPLLTLKPLLELSPGEPWSDNVFLCQGSPDEHFHPVLFAFRAVYDLWGVSSRRKVPKIGLEGVGV